jgi:hypothetical protein
VGHDGQKIATDQREEGLCVPEGSRGMNGESLHRQGHVDGFDNHRYVVNNDNMPGRSHLSSLMPGKTWPHGLYALL